MFFIRPPSCRRAKKTILIWIYNPSCQYQNKYIDLVFFFFTCFRLPLECKIKMELWDIDSPIMANWRENRRPAHYECWLLLLSIVHWEHSPNYSQKHVSVRCIKSKEITWIRLSATKGGGISPNSWLRHRDFNSTLRYNLKNMTTCWACGFLRRTKTILIVPDST